MNTLNLNLIVLYFLELVSFISSHNFNNHSTECDNLLRVTEEALPSLLEEHVKNLNVDCAKKLAKKNQNTLKLLKNVIAKNLKINFHLLSIALEIKGDEKWIDEVVKNLEKERLCTLYEYVLKDSILLESDLAECPRASRILDIIFNYPKPIIIPILHTIKNASKKYHYMDHFFDKLAIHLLSKGNTSKILSEYVDENNLYEVKCLFEAIRKQLTFKDQRKFLEYSFSHFRENSTWKIMAETLLTHRSKDELKKLISVFFIMNLKVDSNYLIQLAAFHHKELFSAIIWQYLFKDIQKEPKTQIQEIIKIIDQVNNLEIKSQSFYILLKELLDSGAIPNEPAYQINEGNLQEKRVAKIWKVIISKNFRDNRKYIEYLLNSDKYRSTHHWSNYKKALVMDSKLYGHCAEIVKELYQGH